LGPPRRGAFGGPGRGADPRRPRGAHRPLGPAPGDAPRADRGRARPRHDHARGAGLVHDRPPGRRGGLMARWKLVLLRLLAPIAAVAFALLVSGIVLELSGNDALDAFSKMWEFGTSEQSIASIINRALPFYLSGVAFAIAFKMGLFNIGVEGQYKVAALFAPLL